MHRYFVTEKQNDIFFLRDDNFHHARNVVRLSPTEEIVCIFEGVSYIATIITVGEDFITAKIVTELQKKLINRIALC